MNKQALLNRLEHYLLTSQCDDVEPLFVLYRGTMRYVKDATLDAILEALVKLVQMGFIKSYFVNPGDWKALESLTLEELKQHCADRSEEDLSEYPEDGEYYFEPTPEGRIEEAKDIYHAYYPQED